MNTRRVVVRRGRYFGWWVEGRKRNGALFIFTWWPTHGMASTIARWVGRGAEVSDDAT